eukprot:1687959-Alexandrium_andersonii.AAC.1
MNGYVYVYPEARTQLPRAWRALQAWHRVRIHGEGSPIPIEIVFMVSDYMREHGYEEEADL